MSLFVAGLEKAVLSQRVYASSSGGDDSLQTVFRNLFSLLRPCFDDEDSISLQIKPSQVLRNREVVYENSDPKKSISRVLFQSGVRALILDPELSLEELKAFIQILATDFAKPENMDSDLASKLFERDFAHLHCPSIDWISERLREDTELRDNIEKFHAELARTEAEPDLSPKRFRQADLKTLEEFRLNTKQFTQTDADMVKIVQSLSAKQREGQEEKQTLERLALMGFHFLISEESPEERSTGRDLLVRVALMTLEAQECLLFCAMVRKVSQLQKDHPENRGEFQKIIDQIFSPDNYFLFKQACRVESVRESLSQLLNEYASSSVKLMVYLLGELPSFHSDFAEAILRELPAYSNWLMDELRAEPSRSCWEYLLRILARKPNQHFSKFLNALLESAGDTVRIAVYRQCAQIGTPEALTAFRDPLTSDSEEDRVAALQALASGKTVEVLKLLKLYLGSKSFQAAEAAEVQEAYAAILSVGGVASHSWFEQEWMRSGEGLFKSKKQNERRNNLLAAAVRVQPQMLKSFLAKIGDENLPDEARKNIESAKAKGLLS